MDTPTRKPSWKARLTSVSKKLGVGVSASASPTTKTPGSFKSREIGKGEVLVEQVEERTRWNEIEREKWCVVTRNGSDWSAETLAIGPEERVFLVDGGVFYTNGEGDMETDGLFDRLRGSKKGEKIDSSKNSASSQSGLGSRKSSFGSRLKPDGSRMTRPGSPQPLQRRSSGRGGRPKLDVYEHQNVNGQSSPRSTSPNRAGSRRKSSNPPSRTESPNNIGDRRHDVHSGLHVKQSHQNGKSDRASPAGSPSATVESAFSKVRDTLKISKAKNKLKKKKGTAYSVDPVEINFPQGSKYQDPFEAQPNFTDSVEVTSKSQSHDFKPVSIPHNKPEYCDHCGETAWGLYRQVLKCSKSRWNSWYMADYCSMDYIINIFKVCDFIVHRKCESKVVIDCSLRLERAVLQRDQLVEETAAAEEEDLEKERKVSDCSPRILAPPDAEPTAIPSPTPSTSHHHSNPQVLSEKAKLAKKIREYNRKTTPVNHIHIKGAHTHREGAIEYQGFVRVHMCVHRPIHVSTAITRTSWYRLMRPVKERSEDAGLETAFYLPTDTNRLVHINNFTTTKELVQILLKKFCVTDNPKKFSLYEEYGGDCRRLFEEDNPLEIALEASVSNRNSKLILRDNTYSTIQWDAFTQPELNNFIQILRREEELYVDKLEERFKLWKECISQAMKEKCKEEISMQTYLSSDVRNGSKTSSILETRTKA